MQSFMLVSKCEIFCHYLTLTPPTNIIVTLKTSILGLHLMLKQEKINTKCDVSFIKRELKLLNLSLNHLVRKPKIPHMHTMSS